MDVMNAMLYESVRRQMLEDLRLTRPDDYEGILKKSQALREFEEAYAKTQTEDTRVRIDPNKMVMGGLYIVSFVALILCDKHFPLTNQKGFSFLAKPKIF